MDITTASEAVSTGSIPVGRTTFMDIDRRVADRDAERASRRRFWLLIALAVAGTAAAFLFLRDRVGL